MSAIRSVLPAIVAFLVCVLLVSPPAAAQSGDAKLGRLGAYLPTTGSEPGWRYFNTGDRFEIENVDDPGAIKYFFVGPQQGSEGNRVIEAALDIHPDSRGSAGLLYGLNDTRDTYHLLTLTAGGGLTVFRRDGSGFRPLLETSSAAHRAGQINTLRIEEKGNEISFFLNGTRLGAMEGNLFGAGSVGIAAVGDVRARFSAFSDAAARVRSEAGTNTQTQVADGAPAGALEVRRVQIVDTNSPAGPMPAYETLVPAGWKTQGGVKWNNQDGPGGCFTGARLIWGAGLEDETYGMAFLDPISWGMGNYGPSRYMCLPKDLTDAEAAMRTYFQAMSGTMQVTITDVQRPAELQPMLEMIGAAWARGFRIGRTWVDGVLISAKVKTAGGQNDAYFLAVTKHAEAQYGQNVVRDGRTVLVMGVFTPPGKLEQGHPGFGAIMNNMRVNPQWQQVEAQWWSKKLREGAPRPGAAPNSDSSIGDMMFESWKRREGIRDAGTARTVNSIWEVQETVPNFVPDAFC